MLEGADEGSWAPPTANPLGVSQLKLKLPLVAAATASSSAASSSASGQRAARPFITSRLTRSPWRTDWARALKQMARRGRSKGQNNEERLNKHKPTCCRLPRRPGSCNFTKKAKKGRIWANSAHSVTRKAEPSGPRISAPRARQGAGLMDNAPS